MKFAARWWLDRSDLCIDDDDGGDVLCARIVHTNVAVKMILREFVSTTTFEHIAADLGHIVYNIHRLPSN